MINLHMHTQPDDESCGPTCLHAIYTYYGLMIKLEDVVRDVERSLSGGTLAPMLGKHALTHGFETTIYVNNLDVFDPTWFAPDGESEREVLMAKLDAQLKHKIDIGIVQSSTAYQEYLELGGKVRFSTLSVSLLKEYFQQKIPILTGLSATYLYRSAREIYTTEGIAYYDDIRGTPCGHFVVLCGYDDKKRHIVVADPHRENPLSHDNYYKVGSTNLINAIMLGVLTYDANLLIIRPKRDLHANDISN
ncbi:MULTISPECIES: C1 family peptidase [Legionella]|uniref:Peptidase-C39 like family protein n=1 Tax=Legionella septentrionalis TaxID=2498109 RepID=A0A3S0XSX8_9GAMM|nr:MULTISPECIES: C39 family peptidase [Legionella]MCP0913862.1 C39 family peptidase [Legionella sp. 27cVA30]RUQ85270.1 peptidase-C39 like family protein [Legionella septentrionalis]RUQ98705.1 peptidase-C39 like family protein [Legionella septentrionalis]RUR09922.1 peptidase-C39 like family protein [Legionella septentrionalis]RUR14998.1 peptidase-C39 like family protein [Legionella septentrionalis]